MPTTFLIAFVKVSFFLIVSSSLTIHSPREPVTPRTFPARPPAVPPSVPSNGVMALKIAEKSCFTISRAANRPLNVFFRFLAVFSLSLNLNVSSFSFSQKSTSCFAVTGGNTSLKASRICTTMLFIPSKAFLKASINAVRPPRSFHSLSKAFLASDCLPIKPPTTSLTFVHRVLASSKLPNIVSQVVAHPEPTASLRVSISCVKVLTSCAAANAFFPISVVSSEYSLRVFTRTSVVIH